MKTITVTELKVKLDNNSAVLIDVREAAEYYEEYIDGSCLIPLSQISLKKLPLNGEPVVIHCRSGKRSADACAKLLAQNPSLNVYSLEGGIIAWKKAGFPTKKSSSLILPIERQTQIAAGSVGLTGILLGTLSNPIFYIITTFVCAGLIFAGITGWCGMAKLLTRMPWNQQ